MRALFSFVGGPGHRDPLIPVAVAVRDAGHEVAFAGAPDRLGVLEAAGFECIAVGRARSEARTMQPLVDVDMAREENDLAERFARGRTPQIAVALEQVGHDWRADVVICDEAHFGGVLAAERLGLPYATVCVTLAGSMLRPDVIGAGLDASRAALDLPPDPSLAALHRYLMIVPCPLRFRDPAFPVPATAHAIRPAIVDQPPADLPAWPGRTADAPTVYFTLGTEFNLESGDLFWRVLEGLRSLPVNVLVTVGNDVDPAMLGPQPGNVLVERYVPQVAVMPRCDVVLCHAGSGTVVGALAFGRPLVLLPMGADQPLNAGRAEALGVARVLDPVRATAADVAEAVSTVLTDPAFAAQAGAFHDECRALPGSDHAALLIEGLAADRQPISRDR